MIKLYPLLAFFGIILIFPFLRNEEHTEIVDPSNETTTVHSSAAAGFDLALVKQLATGQSAAVNPGDTIKYIISVSNQGMEPAYGVEIIDYLPDELTYDPNIIANQINGWYYVFGNPTNVIDSIPVGWTYNIAIELVLDGYLTQPCIINAAEITRADNDRNPNNDPPADVDSTPDQWPDNDIFGGDNVVDNTNNDEDDHDTEKIIICAKVHANDDQFICIGDTATISANGGSSFTWEPAATLDDPTAIDPRAFPLVTTTYYVTITDPAGCYVEDSVLVEVGTMLDADAGPDIRICEGESTQLNATGGVSYSWSPTTDLTCTDCPNPIAHPDTTITYVVTVTNALGCVGTDSVTVTVGAEFLADAGNPGWVCLGQSTPLVASGGVTYEWTPVLGLNNPNSAVTLATPFETTTYTVKVTSATGCMDTDTVVVTVWELPEPDLGPDDSICVGESIQLNAGPGVTYEWAPTDGLSCSDCPNPFASPTMDITYSVTVTNDKGCKGDDKINISVFSFDGGTVSADTIICPGSSTQLVASGGVTYSWTPGAGLSCTDCPDPIAFPAVPTTYYVEIADTMGCVDLDSIFVDLYDLTLLTAGDDRSICIGNSTQLQASGGVSYVWDTDPTLSCTDCSDPIASPTVTTTYSVTITDDKGCVKIDEVEVEVLPLPNADAGNDEQICLGESVQLMASGGTSYAWSPATGLSCTDCADPIANPFSTTDYTVTVTDANGCENTDVVNVVVLDLPVADAGPDVTICEGHSAQLSASGGVSYSWSPATGLTCTDCQNPIATPAASTVYTVTVTDANGCVATDIVSVEVVPSFTLEVVKNEATCNLNNGVANIMVIGATGPFTYSWSPNVSASNFADDLDAGPYSVTVTDENTGCSEVINFEIEDKPGFSSLALTKMDADCGQNNGSITAMMADGTAPYDIVWSGPASGSQLDWANNSYDITNIPAGTYTVTVTDALGCVIESQITVEQINSFAVSVDKTDATCNLNNGQASLSVMNGVGPYTYNWDPNVSSSDVATDLAPGPYSVTVTDQSTGCSDIVNFNINTQPGFTTLNLSKVDSDCGQDNGSITAMMADGTAPYDITWTGPVSGSVGDWATNSYTITGIPAGFYTVTVIDANGCMVQETIFVLQINPYDIEVDKVGASCGMDNGFAELIITGGAGPFTFSWDPDVSSTNIGEDLAAGPYSVTVFDADSGCERVFNFTIDDNTSHTITTIPTGTECGAAEGTIAVSIMGGTPPFDIAWTGPTSGSENAVAGSNYTIQNLLPGNYTVSVTDDSDCTVIQIVDVEDECDCDEELWQEDTICVSACDFPYELCIPIDFDSSALYSYVLNGNAINVDSGCNVQQLIIYNYLALPGNGADGPYTLDGWSVGASIFTGSFNTMQQLVDSMNVWDPTGGWLLDATAQNIIGGLSSVVYGNMFFTHVNSGFEAILGPNNTTFGLGSQITLPTADCYELVVTGDDGCTDTVIIKVCDDPIQLEPDSICVTTAFETPISNICVAIDEFVCPIENVFFCGEPDDGSIVFDDMFCMTYTPNDDFVGTDNACIVVCDEVGNCDTTYVKIIVEDTPCDDFIDFDILTVPADDCDGVGCVCLEIPLDQLVFYTILDNGNPYAGGLVGCEFDTLMSYTYFSVPSLGNIGPYTIDSWDLNGVMISGTFNDIPELIAFMNANDPTGNWTQNAATFTIEGGNPGNSYGMMNITQDATGNSASLEVNINLIPGGGKLSLTPGFHTITVTDTEGCSDEFVVEVTCIPPCEDFINIRSKTVTHNNCDEAFADLCVEVPFSEIGDYNVTLNGNPYTGTISSCDGGAGSAVFLNQPGFFQFIFEEDATGCSDTVDIEIVCVNPIIMDDSIMVTQIDTVCLDLEPVMSNNIVSFKNVCPGSSGDKVQFDIIPGTNCIQCTGLEVGVESGCFVICDDLGFCDTTYMNITVFRSVDIPVARIDIDTTYEDTPINIAVLNNDSIPGVQQSFTLTVAPANGIASINASGIITYSPNEGYCDEINPDYFQYSICNEDGCAEAQVFVIVLCNEFEIFNGFSPNGDGLNDTFVIEGIENYPDNTLHVYNRWGNEVYFTEEYQNDWGGDWQEERLPDGTYFYVFDTGTGQVISGYVQLWR